MKQKQNHKSIIKQKVNSTSQVTSVLPPNCFIIFLKVQTCKLPISNQYQNVSTHFFAALVKHGHTHKQKRVQSYGQILVQGTCAYILVSQIKAKQQHACTTLYTHNMHARHGYDIKLHPHRMLALMTSPLMGRKATTKQTNKQCLYSFKGLHRLSNTYQFAYWFPTPVWFYILVSLDGKRFLI